jgi:hypothetical protein
MRWKLIVVLAFLFFAFSLVSAQEITVHVKTLETNDVYVSILKPSADYYAYNTLKKYSGYDGEATFKFEIEETISNFDLLILVKYKDSIVLRKRFSNLGSNEVYVNFMSLEDAKVSSSPFEVEIEEEIKSEELINSSEKINESVGLSPETEEIEEDTNGKSQEGGANTGQVISDFTKELSKAKYYIFGISAILVLGFFMIVFGRKKLFSKKVEHIDNDSKPIIFDDNKIKDAEKKLKQAREELKEMEEEIGKIQNRKSKIDEAKQKLLRDQEELERLKREGEEGESFYK